MTTAFATHGTSAPMPISTAHQEVMHGIPFSSVGQVYELFAPDAHDPDLGRTCLGQALALGGRLRRAGVDEVAYLRGERHVAVHAIADGVAWLLDPFMLHVDPIEIEPLIASGRATVARYPSAGGRFAELRLRAYSSGKLILAAYSPDAANGGLKLRRRFTLPLGEPIPDPRLPEDEVRTLLYHPAQVTLSIRALSEDGGLLELAHPVDLNGRHPREDDLVVLFDDDDDGGVVGRSDRARFDAAADRLADRLAVGRDRLIEYLLAGVELHRANAPR